MKREPGRGRSGDARGEGDNLRVRRERLIDLAGKEVAPDELEIVIEQGSSAVELEDVDIPRTRVDVTDPVVFAGSLSSPRLPTVRRNLPSMSNT